MDAHHVLVEGIDGHPVPGGPQGLRPAAQLHGGAEDFGRTGRSPGSSGSSASQTGHPVRFTVLAGVDDEAAVPADMLAVAGQAQYLADRVGGRRGDDTTRPADSPQRRASWRSPAAPGW
ncbi:hypothetical protein ACIQI8_18635 [Streptomyces sp. NPDC092369]|uniref:hypothetical protein n=1 Tax=Streptomyces sp. NPDC092369 TaxID=3366015 RepID=UPI0038220B02